VSRLIAQLAMHKQTRVNKIYDPACGSGSLLLQAKKHFDAHIIEDGFWGAGNQPHHLQPGADEHVFA
jgi:type I restriction enzyme M protein